MIKKDELLREIEKLRKSKSLIIVEGKKDKTALEQIGLKNVFILNENCKSIFVKIEEIIARREKCEECIILTDFDKEGKKLYNFVKNELLQRGVKMNNKLRDLLLKTHLSHIEGISTFLDNLIYPR